jgi:hypothetical protein
MNHNAGVVGGNKGSTDTWPNPTVSRPTGKARARKSSPIPPEPPSHARFFLATKDSASAVPLLDQEVSSEGEALVESLKRGQSYFRLEEYKTTADLSGSAPMLKREPVSRK